MLGVLSKIVKIQAFHSLSVFGESLPISEKYRIDPIIDEFSDQIENLSFRLEEFKRKSRETKPIRRSYKTPTQSRLIRSIPPYRKESFNERFLESVPSPLYPLPKVRIGTLLETLESFVSLVSYAHLEPLSEPVSVLTAHINSITHLDYINPYEEITLRGKCIWSGDSSMKIHTWIYNEAEEEDFPFAEATFTTVAKTIYPEEKSFAVPGIQPANDEEKKLFAIAEDDREYKQLIEHIMAFVSADGGSTKSFEDKIFEIYPNHKSIKHTTYKRTEKIYPGTRNIFGKVVGGVALKQSFELARLTARMFAEVKPNLISMDETAFIRPIFVGGSITYTSSVVYSEDFTLLVRVNCEVIRDENNEVDAVPEGERELVSVSHFMFSTMGLGLASIGREDDLEHYRIKKELFPINEIEALLSMEGERIHNLPKNQELLDQWNQGVFKRLIDL